MAGGQKGQSHLWLQSACLLSSQDEAWPGAQAPPLDLPALQLHLPDQNHLLWRHRHHLQVSLVHQNGVVWPLTLPHGEGCLLTFPHCSISLPLSVPWTLPLVSPHPGQLPLELKTYM